MPRLTAWLFALTRGRGEARPAAAPRPGCSASAGCCAPLRRRRCASRSAPSDLAVIAYTGGTTDAPKGVMLTHRNLVANALQVRHWVPDLKEGRETFLCVLPFSHCYGLTTALTVPVMMGASMVILPTFVTAEVLRAIRRHRPTLFPGVPSMYMAINSYPGARRFRIRSIRACISGAAPLPVEVQEAFEKLTRGRLVEGYGQTEASPVTHANPALRPAQGRLDRYSCAEHGVQDRRPGHGRGSAGRPDRRTGGARAAGDGRLLGSAGGDRGGACARTDGC